ncbi:digestive cysteine proteinase 2 isoform X1 [Halyomorpha halys]|uniref:digestive cysteine proteinase 2 isoform X1 n=1 Tax=Halyomorpha halys TaxID=286706 RepID=UPI0006D506DF|nr:cathepsin L1 isoform X1 [Halyomorpha halys]
MKYLIIFLFAATTCAIPLEEWNLFKAKYRKRYETKAEEQKRMKIFLKKKQMIEEHNENYKNGFETYHMTMNRFGDMTENELKEKANISYHKNNQCGVFIKSMRLKNIPDNVDWRQKGAVTPVQNQGNCWSSWAFSGIGSLEGQQFKKTNKLVQLSVQNLLDCSKAYGNLGCSGGRAAYAFNYIRDNGGVDLEEFYPYEGNDGSCRFKSAYVGAEDSGYTNIPRGDEDALEEAVASVGPIAVTVDGSQSSFAHYSGGVYYSENCSKELVNHSMLVVGYGVEKGQEYWLVKNSFGTDWGEAGYIKMAKNKNNNCGIASEGSYPLVQ